MRKLRHFARIASSQCFKIDVVLNDMLRLLEIPMDLRDPSAFSPPLPETRARGARSKDVGKHEGVTPRALNACHLALRQW